MPANTFTCPSCATVLKTAQPPSAGSMVRCPKCAQVFAAPAERPAAPRSAGAAPPRREPARGQRPRAQPPARTAPRKRGSGLKWFFLSVGCLFFVCGGGVLAVLGGLVFLADQPVAVASSRTFETAPAKSQTTAPAATAPAGKPPFVNPGERAQGEDGGAKPKPDDLPPDEGRELDRAVLGEVSDKAVAWVRENNRFRPDHKIVSDTAKLIDDQADLRKGFLLTLDGALLKSGKPTLLYGRSGELFVFELTPEQAKAANIAPNGTVFKSTTEQKDLKRPAPRVKLADLAVENAQALDAGKRITGTVSCKLLEKGPGGLTLRFSGVSGAQTITASQPLDEADLASGRPVSFSFGALNEAGGTTPSGPLVVLLEVCAP